MGALGVGVGFIVTSKFLTIHTDINLGEPTPPWLVPSHPNWIGAWWLPFIMFGGLVALVALLICTFPRKLRSTEKEKAALKADEANANSVEMKLLSKNGEKSNGDVKGKPAVAWHSSASAALGNVKNDQHDDNADAISMNSAHSATARRRHHQHGLHLQSFHCVHFPLTYVTEVREPDRRYRSPTVGTCWRMKFRTFELKIA